MEIKVFNIELDLIAIIESFTSLRWIRRYFQSGEFELHCPLNSETLKCLKKDNIIFIGDTEAGFIETIEFKIDKSGIETLVCQGKFITSYLNRRINWNKVIYDGKAEELMRTLVNSNAINPSDKNRKIKNLFLGAINNLPTRLSYQNSYGNILECLESISLSVDYGYLIEFNYLEKKLDFKVYSGRDLTINQTNYAPCIFSRDFENILNQNYTDSFNNYKNTCLIAGTGEDDLRKKTSILTGNGLNRFEVFVDAREISDKEKVNDIETTIPWNRYEEMLKQKGNEKLGEHKNVETFESKINLKSNVEYKKDFELGDIVTCFDSKWGVTIDTRITEIEEVYESNGLEINITFGNNIPTLIDKIKAKIG